MWCFTRLERSKKYHAKYGQEKNKIAIEVAVLEVEECMNPKTGRITLSLIACGHM